jgi:hypothetical protein
MAVEKEFETLRPNRTKQTEWSSPETTCPLTQAEIVITDMAKQVGMAFQQSNGFSKFRPRVRTNQRVGMSVALSAFLNAQMIRLRVLINMCTSQGDARLARADRLMGLEWNLEGAKAALKCYSKYIGNLTCCQDHQEFQREILDEPRSTQYFIYYAFSELGIVPTQL